jgi:hypothetical protein
MKLCRPFLSSTYYFSWFSIFYSARQERGREAGSVEASRCIRIWCVPEFKFICMICLYLFWSSGPPHLEHLTCAGLTFFPSTPSSECCPRRQLRRPCACAPPPTEHCWRWSSSSPPSSTERRLWPRLQSPGPCAPPSTKRCRRWSSSSPPSSTERRLGPWLRRRVCALRCSPDREDLIAFLHKDLWIRMISYQFSTNEF